MKKPFTAPQLDLVTLEVADIITTSATSTIDEGGSDTIWIPA